MRKNKEKDDRLIFFPLISGTTKVKTTIGNEHKTFPNLDGNNKAQYSYKSAAVRAETSPEAWEFYGFSCPGGKERRGGGEAFPRCVALIT